MKTLCRLSALSLLLSVLPTFSVAAEDAPRSQAGVTQPNVLFIAVDDLNDWVGCMGGHPQARTPNLDRLASEGTLFLNAHCQAPLCGPSRASMLTGLRPSTTGIYGLMPGIRSVPATTNCVTLPQYFEQHGYFTASFGKVFHDGSIPPHLQKYEFNVWGPTPFPKLPAKKFIQTPSSNPWVDWGVFPPEDHDQADWKTADNAIAQLNSRPKDKPFFLAAGFRLPHVPLYVSQKWFDLFPPADQITLPPYLAGDRDDLPFFAWYLNWKEPEPRLSWLKQENQWHALVRAYLVSTTFMDSQLGRVLDALQQSGAATNTVIVLWSDNGWHLGEKDITGKNSLWERSTHVPLIFAGPGVTRGARCSRPVELLDIYPTLVDLCGLPTKSGLEGHSLLAQVKDANAARPWPALTTANQGNDTVRTEQWRYIRYADCARELYNEQNDPNEWTNLAPEVHYAGVINDLERWLPQTEVPTVPGSSGRVLTQTNGIWYWEGGRIVPPPPD